jgi:hypothetical protein
VLPAGAPVAAEPVSDPLRTRVRAGTGLAAGWATAALLAAGLDATPFPSAPERGPAGQVDFTPAGTQPGLLAPLEPPVNCLACHGGSETPPQSQFLPMLTWSGSMMANATRDPLFWAALDVANADVPGAGDFCLRCHSPAGWLGGRVHKTGGGATVPGQDGCLLTGDLDDSDEAGNDFAGLTCHFCHRLMPTGPAGQTAPRENGNTWVDDSLFCTVNGRPGPCRKGPYAYPAGGPVAPPPHGWEYSPFHAASDICANCHDTSSPTTSQGPLRTLILPDGTDTGRPFPLERTASEWREADHADVIFADGFAAADLEGRLARGRTCQECHMRDSADAQARACVLEAEGSRTDDLPVHEFVGGNTWIPQVLKAAYGGPGQLDREAAYDRTTQWAREMLRTRTATLEVALDPWAPGPAPLRARVKVTNLSGHKLPTGYGEGRRMWIHVRARDGGGALLFESGAYDAATGTLTRDPQARVYEVRQGVWERYGQAGQCVVTDPQGREQFHFILSNCVALDNRIPPSGFRPDVETRPVGHAYPETWPGSGRLVNFDVAAYDVPVPPGTPLPVIVTATLRYQTASREYLEFLRDYAAENALPSENALCGRTGSVGPRDQTRGRYVYDLWAASGRSAPETLAVASASSASRRRP